MNDDAAQAILGLLGLQSNPPSISTPTQETPTTNAAQEDGGASDAINCICGFTYDDGFSIACDVCSRWCHAACVGIAPGDVPDEWRCWRCNPSLHVDREAAIRHQRSRQERERKRQQSPGVDRKQRRVNGAEAAHSSAGGAGKRKRRPSVSQPQQHPPLAAPMSAAPAEDEIVEIDEPWTHSYVPIERDIVPDHAVRDKLRKSSHGWRGVTALGPPPSPSITIQRLRSSNSPLSFGDSSIRPPSYSVHTPIPRSPNEYITPYTSTVLPSSTYLADPLNGYARLGMPKPFVHLIGPPLDVALDARTTGNTARFIRSGCRPNAVLRPLLCEKDGTRDGDGKRLAFGVFALKDMRADEEVVLGWEWDDGCAVHALPAVIENSEALPPHHVHHLRHQMASIIHSLSSTFTTCACGSRAADCAIARMASFVEASPLATPSPASPSAELSSDAASRKRRKVDLGPLVGVERGFRTRERGAAPFSGGMNGVEMDAGPSSIQRSVSELLPSSTGTRLSSGGNRRSTVPAVAQAFRSEEQVTYKHPNGKTKSFANDMEVVQEKDEVDMPPRFRKRMMHQSLRVLKDAYRDDERTDSKGSEGMDVDEDTGHVAPSPPDPKLLRPRSTAPSRPSSSLSRILHANMDSPSPSPTPSSRAATSYKDTVVSHIGPETPSVAFASLSLQSPATQASSRWPPPLLHPSSPSPLLNTPITRQAPSSSLAGPNNQPVGRTILAGPGIAGSFVAPAPPSTSVQRNTISSHSYARPGARAEGSRSALSFADLLNPTPASPMDATGGGWGSRAIKQEGLMHDGEDMSDPVTTSVRDTASPRVTSPPSSSSMEDAAAALLEMSSAPVVNVNTAPIGAAIDIDHKVAATPEEPTSPPSQIHTALPEVQNVVDDVSVLKSPDSEEVTSGHPPTRGPSPMEELSVQLPTTNAHSTSPLSSWPSSPIPPAMTPHDSVATTVTHPPQSDFHASSPLSSVPSPSEVRHSPTPSVHSQVSASTVSMGSTPRSPSPQQDEVVEMGEKPNFDTETVEIVGNTSSPSQDTIPHVVTSVVPILPTSISMDEKNTGDDSTVEGHVDIVHLPENPQPGVQGEESTNSASAQLKTRASSTEASPGEVLQDEPVLGIDESHYPPPIATSVDEDNQLHEPTPPRDSQPPATISTVPSPAPKVKRSFKDFAMRKRKQREEEEKARAHEPPALDPPQAGEQEPEATPTRPIEDVFLNTTNTSATAIMDATNVSDFTEMKADTKQAPAPLPEKYPTPSLPVALSLPTVTIEPSQDLTPQITVASANSPQASSNLAKSESDVRLSDLGTRQAKVEIIETSLPPAIPHDKHRPRTPSPNTTSQLREPPHYSASSIEPTPPPPDAVPTPTRRMSAISTASQEDGEITSPPPPGPKYPVRTPPTQPRMFQQLSPGPYRGGRRFRPTQLGGHTLGGHLAPPPASTPTGPIGTRPPSGPRALRAGYNHTSGSNSYGSSPAPSFGSHIISGFAPPRGPSADRARERADRERDGGRPSLGAPSRGLGRGRGAWGRTG